VAAWQIFPGGPLVRTALSPKAWRDVHDQALPAPQSRTRLRLVRAVGVAALVLGVGYLLWRTAATLPGSSWWLAVPLLVLETHALVTFGLYLHVLWAPDTVAAPEPVDESQRSVTVLVPTYNEPVEVLLPTLAAAAALPQAYEVRVLDDGDRAWVRDVADSLGVVYRSRASREHAKAGNLNAALPSVDTELIAVLDADHVTRADFLTNTLGYFADPAVALVQTPQSFYNTDSFEHIRLRKRDYCEQDLFYRLLAEARNAWGAAFWCGTNAVVRVEALRDVGGIATETVTEDIHTSIRLHEAGWKTVYHNEVLARGLAAANSEQYLNQRMRWGSGAMQVLRTDNPLTAAGLNWHQRLSYASTLLGWFDSWRTLALIVLPMLTLLSGGLPVSAPMTTFLACFGGTLAAQRLAMQLLARGRAPMWPSTVFEFVRMPAALRATAAIFSTRPRRFTVTDKGRTNDGRRTMSAPRLLVALLLGSLGSGLWYAATVLGHTPLTYEIPWVAHGAAVWLVLNGFLLAAALRRVTAPPFASERRASVRFPTSGAARLDGRILPLHDLSLTGATAVADFQAAPGTGVTLDLSPILEEPVPAVVRSARPSSDGYRLGLEFTSMAAAIRGDLVLQLFQTGSGVGPRRKALAMGAGLNAADAADAADAALVRLAGLHRSQRPSVGEAGVAGAEAAESDVA
jgi:cellulose synthase (UDP-forming)